MSTYDFIVDNITYSYSSTSNFSNCPYGFKLAYIDRVDRVNNFYGQFGLLVHECFEEFFLGRLSQEELLGFYKDNFYKRITEELPAYQRGLIGKYYAQGYSFFENFTFPLERYDVLNVEDTIDLTLPSGMLFTARPDLVLKEKDSGKNILVDYKTSTPFKVNKSTGKEIEDKAKMDGYWKQMFIYAHALRTIRDMPIDRITIWFPRLKGKTVTQDWSMERELEVLEWLDNTILEIRNAEEFPPNTSSKYFCEVLCGVRESCNYWRGG